MTKAATVLMVSELIRVGCTPPEQGEAFKVVSVDLLAFADGVNRARAAARYRVRVSLSWLSTLGPFDLVDSRGYLLEWQFSAVAAFLSKALSGAPCVVNVSIDDAAKLPAKWTAARIEAQGRKLDALDADAIRAEALSKRAKAELWTDGAPRKAEILDAAARMLEAADVLDAINTGPSFGSLVAGGTNPTALTSYRVAIPMQELAGGVLGWWFAPVHLMGGTDADAVAWFNYAGASVIQSASDWINGGPSADAAGVLFKADGSPLRQWTNTGGYAPSTVDPITCWYAFGMGDSGMVISADRQVDGAFSAMPLALAWVSRDQWTQGQAVAFQVSGAVGVSEDVQTVPGGPMAVGLTGI